MEKEEKIKALSSQDALKLYPVLGSMGSLSNLRYQKKGPRYFKQGRKVIYRPEDIEVYLFENPVLTTNSLP